jgi:hypothetical protein
VRASLVVVCPPFFDDLASVSEGEEPVFVQALVAQPAVEALDVGVLDGLAGIDEAQANTVLIGPLVEGLAGQLGAVVESISAGAAPRSSITRSSTLATRIPGREVSTSIASDSRV